MKAVQISGYGDASVLKVTADASKPTVHEGKVLIEVHADRVFPVEQVQDAFLAREGGKVRGKVVLSFR